MYSLSLSIISTRPSTVVTQQLTIYSFRIRIYGMYTVDNHTVQECTEYYCTYEIKCDTLHKALVIQLQSHHDNISYTLNSFILTLQRLQPTKKKKKKKNTNSKDMHPPLCC